MLPSSEDERPAIVGDVWGRLLPVVDMSTFDPPKGIVPTEAGTAALLAAVTFRDDKHARKKPTHPAAEAEAVTNGAVAGGGVVPFVKPKRRTGGVEVLDMIIAKLTEHHRYADDSCLNDVPIGNNELASAVKVSKSTASAFFKEKFGGWKKYRVICGDRDSLISALKILNGEITPRVLLRADVAR